jgi:hypothetical protein
MILQILLSLDARFLHLSQLGEESCWHLSGFADWVLFPGFPSSIDPDELPMQPIRAALLDRCAGYTCRCRKTMPVKGFPGSIIASMTAK